MMRQLRERPPEFSLNQSHSLARGLVFAGLGREYGSAFYHDSSVAKNHGTLTNMTPATDWVWDAELRRFCAKYLAASSQYVRAVRPDLSNGFTIAHWYWNSSNPSNYGTFGVGVAESSTAYDMMLNFNTVYPRFTFFDSANSATAIQSAVAYPTEKWQHHATTWNGSNTIAFYVNGLSVGTSSKASLRVTANSELLIGFVRIASTGKIADPCVWNRALSESEIQQLAGPSNVMLSGLIVPPRRRVFAGYSFNRRRRLICCEG
jgi:hypothetical protein